MIRNLVELLLFAAFVWAQRRHIHEFRSMLGQIGVVVTDQILGRDDILGIADSTVEPVPVKIPGKGTVYVKPLTGDERDAYESSNWGFDKRGRPKMNKRGQRARMAQLCLVDEAGRRLFQAHDVDRLGRLPSPLLDKIMEAAGESSLLDEDAIDDAAEDFGEAEPAGEALSSV